jgi:isopentenyldiphosphate isomerase
VMSTEELLVQKRAEFKDSWAGKWDISAAGHGMHPPSIVFAALACEYAS